MHKTALARRLKRRSEHKARRTRGDHKPLVVSASLEEVTAAFRAMDPDLHWADLQGQLLPIFRRRRPMPYGSDPALYLERPPGVQVGIGVDIGPAFMHVGTGLLQSWEVSADEAMARAVENVRERAAARRLDPVVAAEFAGVPVRWFQSGESIGSALLLVPDQLTSRMGPEPQLVIAPMRDLLVSMPLDAGLEFATFLRECIAGEDANCLDLPVFSLIDGQLRIAAPYLEAEETSRVH